MEDVLPILRDIIGGLIIATVSAWIAVRLSLRRFRTERWWELKVEAYMDMLNELFVIKKYWESKYSEEMGDDKFTEEEIETLEDEMEEVLDEMERIITQGSFVICSEAYNHLRKYHQALQGALKEAPPGSLLDWIIGTKKAMMYQGQSRTAEEKIKEFADIAKRDLEAD